MPQIARVLILEKTVAFTEEISILLNRTNIAGIIIEQAVGMLR
jgi:phosphoribosylaminoimidazole carboxylase (NCAIR synthetase)